jgi:hypothetical protein
VFAVVSIALYAFSLCLPALPGWPGFWALGAGWFELLVIAKVGPFVALAWFANPVLPACWVALFAGGSRWALGLAIVAVVLSAGFMLGDHVLLSASGDAEPIVRRGAGYGLWLASTIVALMGAVASRLGRSS